MSTPPIQPTPDPHATARQVMLQHHLRARGIRDERVLRAMATVPREEFIEPEFLTQAYADSPVTIGFGQTISQPYIVAKMSELAEILPGERVLEIGFGCGYQTAILLELGAEVWGLELEPILAALTAERLARLQYSRFHLRAGDGFAGWPAHAPFNAILLAAAPRRIPDPLYAQLAPHGRLVAPAGPPDKQRLLRVRNTPTGLVTEDILAVRFVPMRGRAADPGHNP